MSEFYKNLVEKNYKAKKSNGERVYTIENVKTFVKAGKLTKDEYKEITGEDYEG